MLNQEVFRYSKDILDEDQKIDIDGYFYKKGFTSDDDVTEEDVERVGLEILDLYVNRDE